MYLTGSQGQAICQLFKIKRFLLIANLAACIVENLNTGQIAALSANLIAGLKYSK